MTTIQKLAWGYAALFLGVVTIGYIPGFTNDQGLLLGQFKIDPIDDLLHLGSGIWAAYAAWKSPKASLFYFKAFGTFYTADAFLGFFTGYAFTDFVTGNLSANSHHASMSFNDNLAVNLPHFIIGPIALIIGFVLGPKLVKNSTSSKKSSKKA